jgi:hypothetical protein
MEPCSSGTGMCVSRDGLMGLTRGRRLDITGRTSDGRPGRVTYSLMGYMAAVTEMNNLCSTGAATGWMIMQPHSTSR